MNSWNPCCSISLDFEVSLKFICEVAYAHIILACVWRSEDNLSLCVSFCLFSFLSFCLSVTLSSVKLIYEGQVAGASLLGLSGQTVLTLTVLVIATG